MSIDSDNTGNFSPNFSDIPSIDYWNLDSNVYPTATTDNNTSVFSPNFSDISVLDYSNSLNPNINQILPNSESYSPTSVDLYSYVDEEEVKRPKKRKRKSLVDLPEAKDLDNIRRYEDGLLAMDSISFDEYVYNAGLFRKYPEDDKELIRDIRRRIKNSD